MAVPEDLRGLLTTLLADLARQERVRAVFAGGSLAAGTADRWSDLDLHLLTEPGFEVLAWVTGLVRTVIADTLPGVAGGHLLVTPDWLHVDLIVHDVDDALDDLPRVVLLDKDDRLDDIAPAPSSTEPYWPVGRPEVFCYFVGNLVAVAGRGEWLAASAGTAMMRDQWLVPLMLAENGVRKNDGAKRLNRYLTAEQHSALAAIGPIGVDEASVLRAQQGIVGEYLRRGRRLAEQTGTLWPAAVEQAALAVWERELGLRPH
ncbi:hypothetical protein [Aestuariimicrobium ganziense]|uniref:hypothetical protein n=1 Tax=Aestuariimicrobium ganziense TaxID=2773677 RepID=UPI0019410A16|nr:hypothetical protein [Aestuariimicrobium ganziense]